jgi:predicted DNA-binding protein
MTRNKTPLALPTATTYRLEPPLREGLGLLQTSLGRPLNRMVNEAVSDYINKHTLALEAQLQRTLSEVQAYRKRDPRFAKARKALVEAEVAHRADDPLEGVAFVEDAARPGPAVAMVRRLMSR